MSAAALLALLAQERQRNLRLGQQSMAQGQSLFGNLAGAQGQLENQKQSRSKLAESKRQFDTDLEERVRQFDKLRADAQRDFDYAKGRDDKADALKAKQRAIDLAKQLADLGLARQREQQGQQAQPQSATPLGDVLSSVPSSQSGVPAPARARPAPSAQVAQQPSASLASGKSEIFGKPVSPKLGSVAIAKRSINRTQNAANNFTRFIAESRNRKIAAIDGVKQKRSKIKPPSTKDAKAIVADMVLRNPALADVEEDRLIAMVYSKAVDAYAQQLKEAGFGLKEIAEAEDEMANMALKALESDQKNTSSAVDLAKGAMAASADRDVARINAKSRLEQAAGTYADSLAAWYKENKAFADQAMSQYNSIVSTVNRLPGQMELAEVKESFGGDLMKILAAQYGNQSHYSKEEVMESLSRQNKLWGKVIDKNGNLKVSWNDILAVVRNYSDSRKGIPVMEKVVDEAAKLRSIGDLPAAPKHTARDAVDLTLGMPAEKKRSAQAKFNEWYRSTYGKEVQNDTELSPTDLDKLKEFIAEARGE